MQKVLKPINLHGKNIKNEASRYSFPFKKTFRYYLRGQLVESEALLEQLTEQTLSGKGVQEFQKLMMCLLIGELFGLKSLHQLLSSYGILSSRPHQIWQEVSTRDLVKIMNQYLWRHFTREFQRLMARSGSTHSRENLTLVIDGSIFRQWLSKEKMGQYFGKYFSGQINATAYGFSLIVCGMSIGEVLYPLHFHLRRKDQTEVEVAERMLPQVHRKLMRLASSEQWPTLYVSVDSGFRSPSLINLCEGFGFHYIGVPEKPHVVTYQGEKLKVRDLIPRFEALEAQASPKNTPFTWRIRVYYQCIGREVTLLLFRLNGSRKISVILSPSLEIKAKTLRRHWFARTKIEQLFRSIKHGLQIQRSTTSNRLTFLKQFAFALVKALHAQLWVRTLQRAHRSLRKIGYLRAQYLISFHQIERHHLDQRMQDLGY